MVPREAIPGRLALLLTLLLCIINTLNKASNNSPRASRGPTALVRWLIICLVFIFLSLLEYAWILAVYHADQKDCYKKSDVQKLSRSLMGDNIVDSIDQSVTSKVPSRIRKISARRIDHVALGVFPAFFGLTSVLFWTFLYHY